jgi:hypothetical protein
LICSRSDAFNIFLFATSMLCKMAERWNKCLNRDRNFMATADLVKVQRILCVNR